MKNSGFSLIEMMIVVAIVGIITAVALPSYTSYVTRSKRTECRSAVMQVMQQQERYYTQQNAYLGFTGVATGIPMKQFSGDAQGTSACLLSAAACTGSALSACVIVTATPVRADPEVGNITMQSDGTKGCSGTNQSKCWTN